MKRLNVNTSISKVESFREKMNSVLYYDFACKLWGSQIVEDFEKSENRKLERWTTNRVYEEKVAYVSKLVNSLLVFDFVRFVGISGSIAARTVSTEDDIDLFIVVKNDTSWVYRLILWIKNINTGLIRRENIVFGTGIDPHKRKDKLCINFIVEERAIGNIGQSLFTLHELLSLIPIYGEEYFDFLVVANPWLVTEFNLQYKFNQTMSNLNKGSHIKRHLLLGILNLFAFLGQLVYQLLHKPDFKRLFVNYKKGIIAYFPKVFKGHESEV